MNEELELTCPQVELSILGSFFKNPPMFFSYMDVLKIATLVMATQDTGMYF
jgi:hypothetical protein